MAPSGRTTFKPKNPPVCVGDRFGELEIVEVVLGPQGGLREVRAKCGCGFGPYAVHTSNLHTGRSTRCWTCAQVKSRVTRKFYNKYASIVPDPETRRRLLNRLAAAKGRCENPSNKGYRNYGARGVRVCPEWLADKSKFLAYVVQLEGWDFAEYEMDRIDNAKGYEPGNIRFVSKADNNRNRRKIATLELQLAKALYEIEELRKRVRHFEQRAAKQVCNTE